MKIIGGKKNMEEQKEACCGHIQELEDLNKQLEERDCKLEEQKNQLLRLMADFDNYKKRASQERDEIICFSNEATLLALLPILDNFDRAMDHAEKAEGHSVNEEIIKGFALIKKQLEDVFSKMGLKQIEAAGKIFDPFYHEAVLTRESKDHEEGVIIEEMQKGYSLKDKVIRPSMVIVSKKGDS